MLTDICRVCGLPAERHVVEIRSGIAQTVVRDADGRFLKSCSASEADRQSALARLAVLQSIVRSLRWHAGRARRQYQHDRAEVLEDRAFAVEADRKKILAQFDGWYPWGAP